MSTWPESSAATRVASEAIGVKVILVRLCSLLALSHQCGLGTATALIPASRLTRRNGPVPLAWRVVYFSWSSAMASGVAALCFSDQLFDIMPQLPHSTCRIGLGASVTNSTVWSSILTISFTPASRVVRSDPFARTRSAENSTSSAVKSSPSWNLTPRRRWNRQRSGATICQRTASAGSMERSGPRRISPS